MTRPSGIDLDEMKILRDKQQMRAFSAANRASGTTAGGRTLALVPTMGALHAGHLALVEAARQQADTVVVSIFVNPTQFSPGEDFEAYPRDLQLDIETIEASTGVDAVFAPGADDLYGEGFGTTVVPSPQLTGVMCGADSRRGPSHFHGVATIVTKLLNITTPDFAFFGEKDAQQLAIIRSVVADLDIPVEIVGVPTVRDEDGLALSSRNAYMDEDERRQAPLLHQALAAVAAAVEAGEPVGPAVDAGIGSLRNAGFDVEYLEVRNADTLAPHAPADTRALVAAAARLGSTRLIDNIKVSVPAETNRSPA